MNLSGNKEKDFIDLFLDFLKPFKKANVRIISVITCFMVVFFISTFSGAHILHSLKAGFNFPLEILQISPAEVLFNYLKLGFFFAVFFTFPLFIYQFGKFKINQEKIEEKINLFYIALLVFGITVLAIFLSIVCFTPLEYKILYAINFKIASMATSLSALVSTFIVNVFITSLLGFIPVIKSLSKRGLFFNYDTLIKYRRSVVLYFAVFACIIALPVELVVLGLIFLMFFFWYKIVIMMIKKREDENGI